MHILLNVAQASGIQDNSYGWRLVWTVVFTLTMGGEILLGGYLESSSVGTGTLHACTGDAVEDGAEAAVGSRTRGGIEFISGMHTWFHIQTLIDNSSP